MRFADGSAIHEKWGDGNNVDTGGGVAEGYGDGPGGTTSGGGYGDGDEGDGDGGGAGVGEGHLITACTDMTNLQAVVINSLTRMLR